MKKFNIGLCLLVVISFANCLIDSNNSLDGKAISVYSMVWSAKYYNPTEQKTFFFAIPFTFNTQMTLDVKKKIISLNFVNWKNSIANFKIVKEESIKAEQSSFKKMLNFSNDYSKVEINLDFTTNTEYSMRVVKEYQNSFAKSIQIKVTQPESKVDKAFYITFDMVKGPGSDAHYESFVGYLKSVAH